MLFYQTKHFTIYNGELQIGSYSLKVIQTEPFRKIIPSFIPLLALEFGLPKGFFFPRLLLIIFP